LYHIPQVCTGRHSAALDRAIVEGISGRHRRHQGQLARAREHARDARAFPGFEVFVGTEKFLLATLREGGAGCITEIANVNAPAISRAFRERTEERQREIDAVRVVFEKLPMIAALKETVGAAHRRRPVARRPAAAGRAVAAERATLKEM